MLYRSLSESYHGRRSSRKLNGSHAGQSILAVRKVSGAPCEIVVVDSREEAARAADVYAPERLQVQCADAYAITVVISW